MTEDFNRGRADEITSINSGTQGGLVTLLFIRSFIHKAFFPVSCVLKTFLSCGSVSLSYCRALVSPGCIVSFL